MLESYTRHAAELACGYARSQGLKQAAMLGWCTRQALGAGSGDDPLLPQGWWPSLLEPGPEEQRARQVELGALLTEV
jgi:hypothetical protein